MKLPTPVRYAIRILFALYEAQQLSIASIAEQTGIADRTVEKILAALRKNDITSSTAGVGGGARLSLPLRQISLGKLLEILDNGIEFAVCCGEKANDCPNSKLLCRRRAAWNELSMRMQKIFDAITLDEFYGKYNE